MVTPPEDLVETLPKLTDEEAGYQVDREAMLSDLREGYDLGTQGAAASWNRNSLYER